MRGALEVHRELLARGVPHEVVRLPGRLTSADDLPAALGLELGCVAVRCYLVEHAEQDPQGGAGAGDGRSCFAAVLVPAGAVPSPAALLDALSARSVRPARPEQVNAATDCAAGLVCPVGLPAAVEVVADEALLRSPTSYCALGEGGVALGIRTGDLLEVVGGRTAALTAGPAGCGAGVEVDVVVGADGPVEGRPRTIDLDPPRPVRPAP